MVDELPRISVHPVSKSRLHFCADRNRLLIKKLDEQFEVIERNQQEIDGALRQSEALQQAILQKAFTGHLVPQDPSDELAFTLLARLRAEREEMPAIQSKSLDNNVKRRQ